MSLRISAAAIRTYDALKGRPGARPRYSDARDVGVLSVITTRLNELIDTYRLTAQIGQGDAYFLFWPEIRREIDSGTFDDLLPLL
jgi:hypothetical protein